MHWITQLVSLVLIRWIVIYPVDSTYQRLNNRGLKIGCRAPSAEMGQIFSLVHLESMRYNGHW